MSIPWNKALLSSTIAKRKPSAILICKIPTRMRHCCWQRQLTRGLSINWKELSSLSSVVVRLEGRGKKHCHKFRGSMNRDLTERSPRGEMAIWKCSYTYEVSFHWSLSLHDYFSSSCTELFKFLWHALEVLKAGSRNLTSFLQSLLFGFIYNAREHSFRTVCSQNQDQQFIAFWFKFCEQEYSWSSQHIWISRRRT